MTAPFWQVGIVVENIEAAQAELTAALGVTWTSIAESQLEGSAYRVCLSVEGPPHLELLEGPPGSPWDATGGSRLDHLGFWVEDLPASRRRLEAAGLPVAWDGEATGREVNYHAAPASGMRLETIHVSYRKRLRRAFGLQL